MLEPPDLPEEKIAACLRADFGILSVKIDFLPLGNDANAWVFRVETSSAAFFLKLKSGKPYRPSLSVPFALQKSGIEQVLAPLPTLHGNLFAQENEFSLALYPFIAGQNAMQSGMSASQWVEFGTVLKRIHTTPLPAVILAQLRSEEFKLNPQFLNVVKELAASLPGKNFTLPSQRELASFWSEKSVEIDHILARAMQIGRVNQKKQHALVLCHTDIHTANIMIDPQNHLHMIDWDLPMLAPIERDLMFISVLHETDDHLTHEERLFYTGYGHTALDPLALTYYAYEWVVQEIGDYAERVFLSAGYTETTRQDSLRGFKQLFEPRDVVESAYKADKICMKKSDIF
jgi:spectinomycin phosphotransferase